MQSDGESVRTLDSSASVWKASCVLHILRLRCESVTRKCSALHEGSQVCSKLCCRVAARLGERMCDRICRL
eukprot:4737269-Amphidinium_carterae.3